MAVIDHTIDLFVQRINSSDMEPFDEDEVPIFLREGDWDEHGHYKWKVRRKDLRGRITDLEKRLPSGFPPSFRSLITRYAFLPFEVGPIMLYGNTGEDTSWELTTKMFSDSFMSSFLLQRGFIQFGNPYFYNYDPVCFDSTRAVRSEYPIIQFDHEAILCNSKVHVVKKISPSFLEFAEEFINGIL